MKDQLQEKHNTQLQGSLHELREIYEIQIKKIREDLTTDYGQKVSHQSMRFIIETEFVFFSRFAIWRS